MVSGDNIGPRETAPYCTLAEYDTLDLELGKEKVKDVLGDYFDPETEAAVQDLIHNDPGITGSVPIEAMEVEAQEQEAEPTVGSQDQPMETEPERSPRTFHPELMEPGYTPSLISSPNLPLHPSQPWRMLSWIPWPRIP